MESNDNYGVYRFRVSLEQTDAIGVIHNSVVFRILEVAEIEWFRELGIHWLEFEDCFFPRTKVGAEFLMPLRFDDMCEVHVKVVRVRAAKVYLVHEFYKDGELMIKGSVEFACVARDGFGPKLLPEKMREVLETKL